MTDTSISPNLFKRSLAAGQTSIGLWNSLASAATVEVIAGAGFDWVLIDMEHSPNDSAGARAAAGDDGLSAVIARRAPSVERHGDGFLTGNEELARHYLDMGCQFVAVGADVGLLARAADSLRARFKSAA